MAQNLSWTSIALQDLEAIWTRICELGDEREAGLQIEFIHQNIEKLPQFPRRFPVYQEYGHENIREFKLPHTTWSIALKPATTSWSCPSSTPSAISSSK